MRRTGLAVAWLDVYRHERLRNFDLVIDGHGS